MIFFSFIIPIYNGELFLNKCLNSIISQTYNNFEIILINDGSTDQTNLICQNFINNYSFIKYISKPNEGQGISRNIGVNISKGDYILFVDADDWIEPNLLSELNNILSLFSYDFINFGIDFINSSGKLIKSFSKFNQSELYNNKIFLKSIIQDDILSSPCNKCIRKSLLINNNIRFPKLKLYEDVIFIKILSLHSINTKFINSVYYHASVREGSSMRTLNMGSLDAVENLIQSEINYFKNLYFDKYYLSYFKASILKLYFYIFISSVYRIENNNEFLIFYRKLLSNLLKYDVFKFNVIFKLKFFKILSLIFIFFPRFTRYVVNILKKFNVKLY